MTTPQKILCAVALYTAWAVFVWVGMTPIEPLIAAIRDALIALGIFSASRSES